MVALVAVACAPEVTPQPPGASSGSGAGESCDAPDVFCPADKPFAGAPCAGALVCDYDENENVPWTYTCEAGAWVGDPDCSMIVGGACNVPEPAEICPDPVAANGVVEVGPADDGSAFRPFEAGEEPEIVWGPQGGAMIFFRVRIDGEEVPSCVQTRTTFTAPNLYSNETVVRNVRLRCGESLAMYIVVPYGDCEAGGMIDSNFTLEIDGAGSFSVDLQVPADAFCPAFG